MPSPEEPYMAREPKVPDPCSRSSRTRIKSIPQKPKVIKTHICFQKFLTYLTSCSTLDVVVKWICGSAADSPDHIPTVRVDMSKKTVSSYSERH